MNLRLEIVFFFHKYLKAEVVSIISYLFRNILLFEYTESMGRLYRTIRPLTFTF